MAAILGLFVAEFITFIVAGSDWRSILASWLLYLTIPVCGWVGLRLRRRALLWVSLLCTGLCAVVSLLAIVSAIRVLTTEGPQIIPIFYVVYVPLILLFAAMAIRSGSRLLTSQSTFFMGEPQPIQIIPPGLRFRSVRAQPS